METRANFILIGVFTIVAILAGLGFLAWLAKVQIDRQYAYYDILFSDVSGLSRASEVRFNGLVVGQVTNISLSEDDPSLVRARIEIAAETPIKADTKAQLNSQGVTGVAYVSLSGGSPSAPVIDTTVKEGIPVIASERSIVQQITQDAPDLLSDAMELMTSLKEFAGPENQAYVSNILANVNNASDRLEAALDDFSDISSTVADATSQIGGFTQRLEPIAASIGDAMANADDVLAAATDAFDQATATLLSAEDALGTAGEAFATADGILTSDVPVLISEITGAVQDLKGTVAGLDAEARTLLTELGVATGTATARLTQLETTISGFDAMMVTADESLTAVSTASESFETLIEGEGALLVSDARETLARADRSVAAIEQVVTEDVPAVVADVRAAVATANRVVDRVGTDVTDFTRGLGPLTDAAETTLATATRTLEGASASLEVLDRTMLKAQGTLTVAEATFAGANRIIDLEVAPMATDIRVAAAQLAAAVEAISADMPVVTGDLRGAVAGVNDVVARIDAIVAASAPQIEGFATEGLPEFTRFAAQARDLVSQLQRIAQRLERDPARFLLGGQPPDFRR